MAESIKVAVRVRPFNQREKDLGSTVVVEMVDATTKVGEKSFTYDFSYWSHNPDDANYASQDKVHSDIGSVVLANALNGFNGCLFAYGQTGAGKSYSVMGYPDAPGIIPRSVEETFKRKHDIENEPNAEVEIQVWIAFVEIYNEQVRDLLAASDPGELKVMDHPKLGVYIPGLTEAACSSPDDVQRLMDFGEILLAARPQPDEVPDSPQLWKAQALLKLEAPSTQTTPSMSASSPVPASSLAASSLSSLQLGPLKGGGRCPGGSEEPGDDGFERVYEAEVLEDEIVSFNVLLQASSEQP